MDTTTFLIALTAIAVGTVIGWLLGRGFGTEQLARSRAERDLLAQRLESQGSATEVDRQTAAELAPLRLTLSRVEAQVRELERDRQEQFGSVGERLGEVARQTAELREQTAGLSGALNSSGVRGTWGESQLRRILEHSGMLARCDFEEQVSAVSTHDARVRPDVVVHLPEDKLLVLDSKAPLGAFLAAQADGITAGERTSLLRQHSRSLRGHVDELAAKSYWSAFTTAPELVICFVPSDAVLAAALQASPDLYDHAQSKKVVLASPATLLALLRALAFVWQQDTLAGNARELVQLGTELHQRIGTLGKHVTTMGSALRRSVETYNSMIGTLESRVMVTSRSLQEVGIAESAHPTLEPVTAAVRPLTAPELIADELAEVADPRGEIDPALTEPRDGDAYSSVSWRRKA
ncbi:DNA recombination protein RmuC [Ornithinimicrobium cryptoxanthini]|uniref:DNA recombination protein RmuC n=1 Tax=Ornithinimicrobium cryptoxanthini TaxID=2934161 RepID=A0ABY4YK37_9MICO|nr:DNA recombination protein RmuC [Ornithinimicrobium cryptoxanthini]USQ77078.1 DNA recombination protein RmuC [Ornithinimicrobium cryptoxanthini]